MPAYDPCGAEAALTDQEIATIVRSVAPGGVSAPFGVIAVHADCRLGTGHEGDHGAVQAVLAEEEHLAAWLRWGDEARSIQWLADCVAIGCRLFRGHPGSCLPSRGEEPSR